jgi:hypothetical protein
MRKFLLVLMLGVTAILISACGSSAEVLVTPDPDQLTFMFFYTEGWVPWRNMMPIVDGLEEDYQEEITFIRLNAAIDEGRKTFRFYNLPGHPSFLLLNPSGEVLWTGFGEMPASVIDAELRNNTTSINWVIFSLEIYKTG